MIHKARILDNKKSLLFLFSENNISRMSCSIGERIMSVKQIQYDSLDFGINKDLMYQRDNIEWVKNWVKWLKAQCKDS